MGVTGPEGGQCLMGRAGMESSDNRRILAGLGEQWDEDLSSDWQLVSLGLPTPNPSSTMSL